MTLVYSQPVQAANFQEVLYSLRTVSASDAEQGQEEDADADDPEEESLSFYQKLACGEDVSILVIGDSIGNGAGASCEEDRWYNKLRNFLADVYYPDDDISHVYLTNLSMGGNTSYSGYVAVMAYEDGVDYDLVIMCHGQNDASDSFALYYEVFIRAVKTRYPDANVISILESSQGTYTDKMYTVMDLCDHYGIQTVDTIAAFADSGYTTEELYYDSVHPSSLGQEIYARSVLQTIDVNVAAQTGIAVMEVPLNEEVLDYDNFSYYAAGGTAADSSLQCARINDTSYRLTVAAEGIIGINFNYAASAGDSMPEIYIDGVPAQTKEILAENDYTEGLVQILTDKCTVSGEIVIVFAEKEQADDFYGLSISW